MTETKLTDAEPFDLIKAINEAAKWRPVDRGPPVIILDMSRWLQLGQEFSKIERELKAERKRSEILREALSITRGQWIHSVHESQCLEALDRAEKVK